MFSNFISQFEFHSNGYTDLVDSLGADCVPDEYGGKNGPIDHERSLKLILSCEKLLARNRQFGFKN